MWTCNSAATIHQGAKAGADARDLKEKLAFSWAGPFKELAVGTASSDSTPDGRPLAAKLLYVDLPKDMLGVGARCRVSVERCKPCANPHDANDSPR